VADAVLRLYCYRGGDGVDELLVCRFCGARFHVIQHVGGKAELDELPRALLHTFVCGEDPPPTPSCLIF